MAEVRAIRLGLTRQALRERSLILCIDETGDRKKGKTTDYAASQYIGNLHGLANGVVSVNAYGALDTAWLRLYPLPRLTARLADRCALMNTYHPTLPT